MDVQNLFVRENHIYKITKDVNLGGLNITIPANCTLDFQGGRLINGGVIVDNTRILPYGCVLTDFIPHGVKGGKYMKGQCFFDVNRGKPIFWDGGKWVDASGTAI